MAYLFSFGACTLAAKRIFLSFSFAFAFQRNQQKRMLNPFQFWIAHLLRVLLDGALIDGRRVVVCASATSRQRYWPIATIHTPIIRTHFIGVTLLCDVHGIRMDMNSMKWCTIVLFQSHVVRASGCHSWESKRNFTFFYFHVKSKWLEMLHDLKCSRKRCSIDRPGSHMNELICIATLIRCAILNEHWTL